MPKQGDRISNYLLEDLVGSGSFAQVWRAKHHVLDEIVAIKIPTDIQYVRNFRQEGVAVHGIRHPNVVRAMDIDPYADIPYMVMEFVDGKSLRAVIDERPGGLTIEVCVRIMRGVLCGLQAANDAGIVHRDIKPANILLRMPDGDLDSVKEGDVKLTDFGLGKTSQVTTASLLQSGSIDQPGHEIAGTLVYMSPEQRAGSELDGRSDLYSCAVVLFEMLTGTRPAGIDMPSNLRAEIPQYLDEVFRGSYTRLDSRFSSASAMLSALDKGERLTAGNARVIGKSASNFSSPPVARTISGNAPSCPNCHRLVSKDDNYCIHCQYQLVDTVPRCSQCNAFVSRDDKFCIFCGVRLSFPPDHNRGG